MSSLSKVWNFGVDVLTEKPITTDEIKLQAILNDENAWNNVRRIIKIEKTIGKGFIFSRACSIVSMVSAERLLILS